MKIPDSLNYTIWRFDDQMFRKTETGRQTVDRLMPCTYRVISCNRAITQHTMSVEILSIFAQLYEKFHLKTLTIRGRVAYASCTQRVVSDTF